MQLLSELSTLGVNTDVHSHVPNYLINLGKPPVAHADNLGQVLR